MTQTVKESALVALSREGVEAFSRRRGEPDWLRAARLAAWERFEARQKPTSRDESWRRTDLSGLDLDRLAAPAEGSTAGRSAGLDAVIGQSGAEANLLVIRNGELAERRLDERLGQRGVLLMDLAEAARERPELIQPYLAAERSRPNESKLTALAQALWQDGALLYVPRGVVLEDPIQIVHWSDGEGSSLFYTLLVADEAASVTVVDAYGSPEDRPESLSSGIVDVVVRQAARVGYLNLQERDEQTWHFASMVADQDRDSALTGLTLMLGGRLSRTDLACELRGQGAEADLFGLVFGEQDQHFDLQSFQEHIGSDTRSDLVQKVALRDRSSSNFTGMIRVGLKALRTASNQESRNLLLDPGARADADPKLEILNSDVNRCGHGAAVGPVDEELIFYLMTRGLSHDEAERLIVEGFFNPLLDQVPLEAVRERLWAAIHRKLGAASA
jgi:Fe-S cluster assembly protein SufD